MKRYSRFAKGERHMRTPADLSVMDSEKCGDKRDAGCTISLDFNNLAQK